MAMRSLSILQAIAIKLRWLIKRLLSAAAKREALTAYFDADHNLQIFGGTLSGQAITLTGDNKVANNQAAAARFGLNNTDAV